MVGTINDVSYFQFAFEGYKITDSKFKVGDGSIQYTGFLNSKGQWYIMEQTSDVDGGIAYRYVKGDSAYTTAFIAREGLDYDYFDEIFK